MDPVLQFQQTVGGVTVFEDLDRTTVFYVPRLLLEPLKAQLVGPKHLLQGSGSYGLDAADLAALQVAFPNRPIAPLAAKNTSLADPFGDLLQNHDHTLKLIQQLPFPKLVFAATLDTSKPDYPTVLQALKADWVKLLVGQLTLSAELRDVSLRASVAIDNVQLKALRQLKLPSFDLSELAITAFVEGAMTSGEVAVTTTFGGNKAMALASQAALERVRADHFIPGAPATFDDSSSIRLYQQMGTLVGSPKTTVRLAKSRVVPWTVAV